MRNTCLVVFVLFLSRDARGYLADQMAEVTTLCCNQGTSYARNHSLEDCSSSKPPDIPSNFGSLCIFAMDGCCKEYFQKKKQCDAGIDMATNNGKCESKDPLTKDCCNECTRGVKYATESKSCEERIKGGSAEQLLPADSFRICCQNATRKRDLTSLRPRSDVELVTVSKKSMDTSLASVCEEYAPDELCAHHCIPIPGSYKCECNPGYMLMPDGRNCKEVTKNRCKPRNSCQHKCNDNGVEVKCSCRRGYQLMEDGHSCQDIDECLADPPVCLSDTQCHNIQGSYKCIPIKKVEDKEKGLCPPGFAKNIANNACDDINECLLPHPPCSAYLCENTLGGYKCGGISGDPVNLAQNPRPSEDRCPPGYKSGYNEECEDVDECLIQKDDCNLHSQFCVNTRGSFYCQDKGSTRCPPGFKVGNTGKCEDINECEDGHEICRQDQICVNQLGEYDCRLIMDSDRGRNNVCPEGMRVNPSTNACEDIDECVEGTHLCDQYQLCLNTNGSHECRCKLGFEHDSTTGACVDVNECATEQHECIAESQRCDNTVGSYLCVRFTSCGTGYILHHSTSKCEDIDECALGTHNCARAGAEYQCVNYPGSFRCVRRRFSSTSSTTASSAPEYEYEYYDSDEEPSENITEAKTESKVVELKTTTTVRTLTALNESTQPEYKTDSTTKKYVSNDKRVDLKSSDNKLSKPKISEHDGKKYIYKKTKENDEDVPTKVPETLPESSVHEIDVEKTSEETPKKNVISVPRTCQTGFKMDESGACFDIDECATNKHSCSGLTEICKNTMGGYLCECASGFRRDFSTGSCDLIPSTTSSTTSPSTTPSSDKSPNFFWGYPDYRPPTVRPFRPRNLCDVGFHLNTKTGVCEDINECTNGQANCAAAEVCVNTEGGYRCECPPNWRLDEVRHRCVPLNSEDRFPPGYGNEPVYPLELDELTSHKHTGNQFIEAELTPLGPKGSVIKCPWGYRLGDDNTCEDIDECSTGGAQCGAMQLCTNLPGGYTCSCPRGHRLVGDHECEDIDECDLSKTMPICSQNADCINTVGSFQCQCHQGFRTAPANDKVCMDVDECTEVQGSTLCEQRCNNVWGGYRCSCHRGYKLDANNRTCSDVDECTEFKSKVLCVGRCLNEPGSYRCACPTGYRLSEDKRSCIDIDECETGEAPCSNGGGDVCLNTRGGYRCHRIACPPGYRLESKHRCTKMERVCPPNDWDCAHQPTTYSYNFITFVSKLYIPASKVDLFTMRGPSWPYAKMKFELRLVDVNSPPTVKDKADINAFLLVQTGNQAVVSLVRSLEGPQSIELELSMELHSRDQFGGIAVAKLFIHVSEYEF